MNLETILRLLPKVGPIIAAAPEFKALIEDIISALTNPADQETLKVAYAAAIEGAAEAHQILQEIVARHS